MQTSVEWLYERLERMIPKTALYNIDKKEYFEQAKEMHRREIITAARAILPPGQSYTEAEYYYDKTFKK